MVTASFHEWNDVIEFPERATGVETEFPEFPVRTAPAKSAPQRIGVQAAVRTEASIALSDHAARRAWVALVVLVHAGRVPAPAQVGFALAGAGSVKDFLPAPSADPLRCVAERDLGTPVSRQPLVS